MLIDNDCADCYFPKTNKVFEIKPVFIRSCPFHTIFHLHVELLRRLKEKCWAALCTPRPYIFNIPKSIENALKEDVIKTREKKLCARF